MIKILVPLDFSSCSEDLCRLTSDLATFLNAEIYLFNGYLPLSSSGKKVLLSGEIDSLVVPEHQKKAKEQLDKIANGILHYSSKPDIRITKELREGRSIDQLSYYVDEIKPDLILVSTHSVGDRVKQVLGSRSYRIVISVDAPVLSLPDRFKLNLNEVIHVAFVSNNNETAKPTFQRLLKLFEFFRVELHYVDVCPFGLTDADEQFAKELAEMVKETNNINLKYHFMNDSRVLDALKKIVDEEHIDVVALSSKKKPYISSLFFPGLLKNIYFKMNKAMLVFHS